MNPLAGLAYGFSVAITPVNTLAALVGAIIGTAVGVLPGMSPTATIAVLLALTLHLKPETALIMLAAIYYGSQYGDSMTAILMNMPSEAPSVVIARDGYQLTLRGRAGPSLAVAAVAAFAGATIGLAGLMLIGPLASSWATALAPPEYFVIALFGLLVLSRVTGGTFWKGLVGVSVGLALTTIGQDPITGSARFVFGQVELTQGLELVPVAVGLFGMTEIIHEIVRSQALPPPPPVRFRELFPSAPEWRRAVPAMLRGSGLGFVLGALPGPSLILSTFASYAVERRLSRSPTRFGEGAIEAVAGPKAADDAAVSGNLVPLMTLGLPFNPVTAVLFAGLLLHGVQPGPLLVEQHPEIFWSLVAAMYLGNVALLALNFPLVGVWVHLLRIPSSVRAAILVLFMLLGVYSLRNSLLDLVVLVIFGMVGYVARELEFDRALIVLGMVLGTLTETALRESLNISLGNPGIFVQRPISAGLLFTLATILVVFPAARRATMIRRPGEVRRVAEERGMHAAQMANVRSRARRGWW